MTFNLKQDMFGSIYDHLQLQVILWLLWFELTIYDGAIIIIALTLQVDCDYKLNLISLEFNSKKSNKHLKHWTRWNTSDEYYF